MDPVVIALTRGMVIVGDVAWAVKGIAAPERIRLAYVDQLSTSLQRRVDLPLCKIEARITGIDKVTVNVSIDAISVYGSLTF